MKLPVVGDIVLYACQREGDRAAIVVDVINQEAGIVDLFVLFNERRNERFAKDENGEYFTHYNSPTILTNIQYAEEAKPGTWHWKV